MTETEKIRAPAGLPSAPVAAAVAPPAAPPAPTVRDVAAAVRRWDWTTKAFVAALAVLYWPTWAELGTRWFEDEYNAHGVFILPVVLWLLWMARGRLAEVRRQPSALGVLWVGIGLTISTAAYLLQLRYVGFWGFVVVAAGAVLALWGREAVRVAGFPIGFLVLAGGVPNYAVDWLSLRLQSLTSLLAAWLLQGAGVPLDRAGNVLEIPGARLEVADACSGFKKTLALLAFALLYGYLARARFWQRIALVVGAVPIAVLANLARVLALAAVAYAGGAPALEHAHDWAEIAVLVLAFLGFVGLGKAIGCVVRRPIA